MFTGKTIVVTGAAAGIGRAFSLTLAGMQANVVGLDVDEAGLGELREAGEKQGSKIETRVADVADLAALQAVAEALAAAHQPIAIWINNAGIAGLGEFLEIGDAGFAKVLDVNLRGVVNGTRVALKAMEAQGQGHIVNMASVAGHLPAAFMTAYCTSKHAVVGFTRSLQAELKLKDSPVRLLLVCPGFVDTKIIAKGTKLGYPEWLSFLLAKPEAVVSDVLKGLRAGKDEVYPTFNGKLMKSLYGVLPKATVASSRILLTRSLKDFMTNRIER